MQNTNTNTVTLTTFVDDNDNITFTLSTNVTVFTSDKTAVNISEISVYVNSDKNCDTSLYILHDADKIIYNDEFLLNSVYTIIATALRELDVDAQTALNIASTIDYSEQGLQDNKRIDCDAHELGEFIRTLCIQYI